MSGLFGLDFRKEGWKPGPLLPQSGPGDSLLIFVVAILVFLACATGLTALAANRAAGGWAQELVGSATVLVRPVGGETPDTAAARATEVLAGVQGVEQAVMLQREEAEALLRPWLGADVLADLPIPRLITVELDRQGPATGVALQLALAKAGIDGEVDDHSLWTKDIVRAGRIARISSLGVALLLALAAGAVIAHATRSALFAYREPVQVLHLAGADDHLVASLLARRFGVISFRAALYGAAAAVALGAALRWVGGPHGATQLLPIAWSDLGFAVIAPPISALVGVLAARTQSLSLLARDT